MHNKFNFFLDIRQSLQIMHKKVKVSNATEMVQSERNSQYKSQGEKI